MGLSVEYVERLALQVSDGPLQLANLARELLFDHPLDSQL